MIKNVKAFFEGEKAVKVYRLSKSFVVRVLFFSEFFQNDLIKFNETTGILLCYLHKSFACNTRTPNDVGES